MVKINNKNNEDNITKYDIKDIPFLSFYCRYCEEIVPIDIDKKDKKCICVKCKNKSILIGTKNGIEGYINVKK